MKIKNLLSIILSSILLVAGVSTASAETTTVSPEEAARIAANAPTTAPTTASTTAPTATTTSTAEIDYYADDYYDTDGNASLIESKDIIYESSEMQFIAVTTKDGHVFYILINYSAQSGEDSVYFLNKVDDYDLYALLNEGEDGENSGESYTEATTDSETEETTTAAAEENTSGGASNSMNSSILILVVVVVAGVVGFVLFKFVFGKKKKTSPQDDYDDLFDDDDEDEINEDEDDSSNEI